MHFPDDRERPRVRDRWGLQEITLKQLLDRQGQRSWRLAPSSRNDFLCTACTIRVVTPLHSGILGPILGMRPLRLPYGSLGTLFPPHPSGNSKPGLVVGIYSLPCPEGWYAWLDILEPKPVQVDPRSLHRPYEIGCSIMGPRFRARLLGFRPKEGPSDGNDDVLSCILVLVLRVFNSSL